MKKEIIFDFFGTKWSATVQATPAFYEEIETLNPVWLLVWGVLFSFVLFGFFYALSYTQRNAMRLASNMTIDLRKKMIELEKANADFSSLIYLASHDIKSPLHGVHSVLEWIQEDLGNSISPQVGESISKLKIRIKKLTRSLEKLVEYARILPLAKELKLERTDVKELIEQVFYEEENPNKVELVLPDQEFPILSTHHVLLQSVLSHLVQNALQYSQETGGKLHVMVVEDAGYLIFELKDNGLGMSEEQLHHAFDFYQSSKASEKHPTLGMGLAIAKKVVETYGGVIKIVSNEWGGVTCYLTWPIRIDPSLFDGFE